MKKCFSNSKLNVKKSIFVSIRELKNGGAILFTPETQEGSMILLGEEEYNLWKQDKLEELLNYGEDAVLARLLQNERFIISADEDQLETNRKLRENAALKKEKECINFTIAPTLFCNARCKYCFEKEVVQSRMSIEVANEIVRFIICISKKYNARRVYITWFGGEPLLEKKTIEEISDKLIGYFADNYQASIITNGSLIDDSTIELFKKCHITDAQITLDGIGKAYDRVKN